MNKDESFFFADDGNGAAPELKPTPAAMPADTEELEFVRELGRGGMGVVYECIEKSSRRRIALKVIHPRKEDQESNLARFEREARAAARIAHPNCVFVYGFHVVDEHPAIAMEFIEGQTLEERLKKGGTPDDATAVQWILEVLSGVEAAHAAGVLHRDIKPANLFLTRDGHVKVGDFGLARSMDVDPKLTVSGVFVGSPLYASPEQVRGRQLDLRSDIYSIGATLYAALTGSAPWRASSLGDLFAQIATEPPIPPRRLQPQIPRALEKVVLRSLEKDPARRYPDCAAFREALLPFAPGSLTSASLAYRAAAHVLDLILLAAVVQGMGQLLHQVAPEALEVLRALSERMRLALEKVTTILWFGVFDGLAGATPAKRLVGLRVSRSGRTAGLARGLYRAAVFSLPAIAGIPFGPQRAIVFVLGYLALASSMRRRNGYRGLHDWASGTRMLQIKSPLKLMRLRSGPLDPERGDAAGLPERLALFDVKGRVQDAGESRILLARDSRLDRDVWIHQSKTASSLAAKETGPQDGVGLRWIAAVETDGGACDVFESPGGASLAEYEAARARVDWAAARGALIALCGLIAGPEGAPPFESLWIDARGRLRLLPFATRRQLDRPGVKELVARSIRALLAVPPGRRPRMPEDVPDEGATLLLRVVSGDADVDAGFLRRQLEALDPHPQSLGSPMRSLQLGLSGFGTLMGMILALAIDERLGFAVDRTGMTWSGSVTRPWLAAAEILALGGLFPTCFLAFLLRGGAGFSFFGIRIVDRFGFRVGRWRCTLRAFLLWLPPIALLLAADRLSDFDRSLHETVLGMAAGAWMVLTAVFSVLKPQSGPVDLVIGTQLVR